MEQKNQIAASKRRNWSTLLRPDNMAAYLPTSEHTPRQKFGFIKRVDKGWITTVIRSDEGLILETSAF